MLNITKGKISRAQKVVIYGPEGIGKSSLAARFPDPVIIDTEGGTAHMDIRRIDKPRSWEEMLAIVKEVANTPGICKTLVIDTAQNSSLPRISARSTSKTLSRAAATARDTPIWPRSLRGS